jgi:hypothetical protein
MNHPKPKQTLVLRKMGAKLLLTAAAVTALCAQPTTTPVGIFGSLYNFDVYNDTGEDTHGFQIELDGITPDQVEAVFPDSRYGAPTIVPFAGGVYVRYASAWDPAAQQYVATTIVPPAFTPTGGHSCVLTMIPGCDHYGVVSAQSATNTVLRWLVDDPANPGSLIPFSGPPSPIPVPVVSIVPPVQAAAAPVVVFQIRIPNPPRAQFGPAQWVKVYKTELPHEVALNDLLGGNPAVPQDAGHVETQWKLLQTNPNSANSGVLSNQGGVGSGSHSVVRRYEFYKYTGQLAPGTNEALCATPECPSPGPGELGDYIGDQMAAVNIGVPSVTVVKTGNGTVQGASGKINCGGACTTNVAAGAAVTLTANPGGTVFSGWGGACSGTNLSCSLTVNNAVNVTAAFTPIHTLSLARSNSGVVTGSPAGVGPTQINCGSSCSVKFAEGTVVSLTATPSAGKAFVNWTGGCTGTSPTCSVTISADTQVQAIFK